ncbi:MAG TPA: PAS domain-containing protein [Terriglobales bacterium]|nr:PAS domain-containing protein [Terriglobales bacterium]
MASPGLESNSKHLLEAQLQATLNVIPAYAWFAAPSGGLTFTNERLSDYLGLPKDHPLRLGIDMGAEWDSHVPLLHPDDHDETRIVWSTCLRTGCAGEATFRVRNAKGTYRWFLSRAEPLRTGDGPLLYWVGVNLEIEDRKQAEEKLRSSEAHLIEALADVKKSEERLRLVVDSIPALIHTARPDGYLDYFNRRWLEYLGVTLDKVAGWNWTAFVHPEDVEGIVAKWRACLATGEIFEYETRVRRANGEYRWMFHRKVPLRDANGIIVKWYGSSLDIDERKTAEEQLRRNARELQRSEFYLAEGQRLAHIGSWAFDSSGFDYWSLELFRMHGIDPGSKPPKIQEWLDLLHPQNRESMADLIRGILAKASPFDATKRIVRPNGEVRYVRYVGVPLAEDQSLKKYVGSAIDVTEHELLTQELRRREAYLTGAQRLSRTGSFGWRPDSGEIVWSDETYRIFEYDRAEKPTVNMVLQRTHPQDRALHQQVVDRGSQTGADFELEYRLLLADGRVKHVHSIAHALQDASGNREFFGAVTDITDRKTAEEKIRAQESELRQMLDFMPQYLGVLGADGTPIYANRASLDYLGMDLDEWQRRRQIGEEIHPDDLERVTSELDQALSTGSAVEIEERVRKGDGSFRWFLSRCNPVRDENGQVTRLYLASTDIHDRKTAEERLQQENVALREEIDKASMFEEIIGTSPALKAVLSRISKVAPSDSTVLITGETGTGKELVARAIHRRSPRGSRPFVSVNCAAIPRDLIASELFGHEKGAFTGATQQRLGRFELANGGTIFLDEVGELPAETQIALLRVLQEHEFERVGGSRRIRADVRVIAATNRDLQAAIGIGSFRSDLYYRLHVFPIDVPSLRQRREDIPLLVEYFIDRYARKAGKDIRGVNKKTLQLLQSYPWPGNIRELQNVIERSVILCETEIFSIDENWLPQSPPLTVEPKHHAELPTKLLAQEKNMIEAALKESRGRVSGLTGAAAMLGIPRSTLESKIRSLKINKNRFKT